MAPSGRWVSLAALLLVGMFPSTAQAQHRGDAATELLRAVPEALTPPDPADMPGAPLRSLAVPGWGQLHMGQRRGWAYLTLEALGWLAFTERTMAGGNLRDEYRELAWITARGGAGARQDGDFAYYEFMSKWTRSGAFDAQAAVPGIQPEPDPTAFNGSIWALAKDIYFPAGLTPPESDPAYQRALAYYVTRAYGPDLEWDWSAAPSAQAEFVDLIHASDDRFRQATAAVGVLIANHLISAADAYLSGGTRRGERPLAVWAEPFGSGTRFSAFLRIGVPSP